MDDKLNKEVSSREKKLEALREKVQKQKDAYKNENKLMRETLIETNPLNIETVTQQVDTKPRVLIEPTISMDLKMLDLPKVTRDDTPTSCSTESMNANTLEDIVEEYKANKNKKTSKHVNQK